MMPVETLKQLKALRQGIADSLQKDPRFLTLNSLDKSIGEISKVLVAAGVIAADEASQRAPAFFSAAEPAKSAAAPLKKKKKKKKVEPQGAVAKAGDTTPDKAEAAPAEAKPAAVAAAAKDEDAGEDADEDEDADQPNEPEPAPKLKAAAGKPADAGEDVDEDEAGHDRAEAGDDGAGRAGGYIAMAARPGAAQYQPSAMIKFAKLPNKVDLRSLMTPVEDQGQTSSCVANAVAGAYEYWIKKATRQDDDISRLFVYYNARWRDGSQDKDDGSVIQLAMEGLAKFGACSEKVWPFDKKLLLQKPGGDAYKDAAPRRVQDMAQVPLTVEAWKQALAEGKPIVFGCLLFDSFDECNKRGGVVPMPEPEDLSREKHSGHSMCAVGYSDTEKVFIVRNSWGTKWGDKGYCYMPYDYLMNPKFNDGDCWVFVPRVPLPPPRDVWSDTTTPVTNDGRGVDFVINPYTIEDYARVAIDLFETVRRPFNATLLPAYSEYVSWASLSQWSRFEQFDVSSFLSQTTVTEQISTASSTSTSTSVSETTTETSEESSEESSEEEDDDAEDAEDAEDDAEEADESDASDDDAEDDDAEEDDADEDDDTDTDENEDKDDDTASDEDEKEAEESDDDSGDADDAEEDEAEESDDSDEADEESEGDDAEADEDDESDESDESDEDADDEDEESDEAEDESESDDDADEADEAEDADDEGEDPEDDADDADEGGDDGDGGGDEGGGDDDDDD